MYIGIQIHVAVRELTKKHVDNNIDNNMLLLEYFLDNYIPFLTSPYNRIHAIRIHEGLLPFMNTLHTVSRVSLIKHSIDPFFLFVKVHLLGWFIKIYTSDTTM